MILNEVRQKLKKISCLNLPREIKREVRRIIDKYHEIEKLEDGNERNYELRKLTLDLNQIEDLLAVYQS